jgi:predicted MPP superfamily phosphohydrolase
LAVFGFVALILVVVVLLHLYLWKRLVRDPLRPGWPRRIGSLVALLLTILIPATLIGVRAGHVKWLAWPGYLWLALMFYLFVVLLVLELPRLAIAVAIRAAERTQKRRTGPDGKTKTVAHSAQPNSAAPADQSAPGTTDEAEDAGRSASTNPAGTTGTTDHAESADRSAPTDPAAMGTITPQTHQVGHADKSEPRDQEKDPATVRGRDVIDRRLLLARGTAIFAGLTAAAITGYGVRTALGPPQINRVQIPLPQLPRTMDGTRLAVVSDIHLGPLTGSHHVGRIVDLINSTGADIVCVVGDLVDGTVPELGRFAQPLADIQSKRGAYFVTGNHEYYSGFQPWIDEVARLGVRPLRNERLEIAGLDLAGVNDLGGVDFGDGPDFAKALADRDTTRPVVLMAHQPVVAHEAAKFGVDLQVSGHTHGGQMAPFNRLVKLQQPVVSGFGRVDGVPVFVTNGAGFWGPPVRVGAPPQVTVIDLRAP